MKTKPVYDVGVIVGRFQVPELHRAHIDLIESVLAEHDKTIVVLGVSPLWITRQNPLDFESRKQMLLQEFPDLTVVYAKDMASDGAWSHKLDGIIDDIKTPGQSIVLYGGRNSFITRYSGRYPTQELLQEVYVSGEEQRKAIAREATRNSVDFRRGVVWAAYGQYPTCYPTVDVAVLDGDRVLLGRKPHEDAHRFIGGFADPSSPSYEADARREVQEEAHVAITDPVYLGSFVVDDWRYRDEIDSIKTIFFKANLLSGSPQPDDDIAELRWFDLDSAGAHMVCPVVPSHEPLYNRLLHDWTALP